MSHIPLPWPDTLLLLSPDTSVPPAFTLVVLCLIPVILALWLSSYEFRSATQLAGIGLLALRLGCLGVVLVVGWFAPALLLALVCVATGAELVWLFAYDLAAVHLGGALIALTARLTVIVCLWVVSLLVPALLLPLLCLVSVALVACLCWYELQVVRRSAALALLTLRLVVLLLFWFLLCLQPIMARTMSEELPGRVLVAVDRSDSMDVADPQRDTGSKLRLARALHLTGDIPEDQLDVWIRQAEAGRAPEWVRADEYPDDPERRRQIADQRRRQHDELCQQVDTLTRSQVARGLLADDGVGLLKNILAKHQVDLMGFARDRRDVKPDQLEELFRPQNEVKDNGQVTDLRLPLLRALERSGPDQGKVLGIVVLTDGQHNTKDSPVPRAIELGQQKLPIYPIALGARQAPPDVAIRSVKAPGAAFKGDEISVEVRFKVTSLPAQAIVVELKDPGKPEPHRQTVQHDGSDRDYTVHFRVRMDQVGSQALAVAVRPVPGEIRSDNNSRSRPINVADDQAKVLLVDGEARWEYHYLANALNRDRTVKLQQVVFVQPRVGAVSEDELKKMGNPARELPTGPDALAGFDCIVLGDTAPDQLADAERQGLEKYVADRGGTLVIVAGKRFMPLAFQGASRETSETGDPLLNLLPIESPRVVNLPRGFPVTLTEEGQERTDFLTLAETSAESARRWSELPRHYWAVVGRAKKSAVPLAYLEGERSGTDLKSVLPQNGDNPKSEARSGSDLKSVLSPKAAQEKENALIVRQNYGFGRVLYIGLDSTWRWRFRVGDAYHHRFWGQLVHWAASDKPLVTGNDYLRFGTSKAAYRQGEEVDLVVRLSEELGGPGRPPLKPDALAGARIVRPAANGKPEEAVALVPLDRVPAQPRVLDGRLRDLPAGQYSVELAIPELADKLYGPPGPDGKPRPLRATFTITPPESEEMIELGTNRTLLDELAAKSGGQVYTAEDAATLVEKLTQQTVTREYRTERKLWQEWLTLVVFVGLLTAEWVGRKLAGLP